jgi:hypothetical protein
MGGDRLVAAVAGDAADERVSAGAVRVLDSPAKLQQTLGDLPLADLKLDR